MVTVTPVADLTEESEQVGLPPLDRICQGDVLAVSLKEKTNRYTHGLHRFPAKYVPQVPRWAIENLASPGAVILDPFMGSGTTLVEGLMSPVSSIGIDRDPLAQLITRAKISPPTASRLERIGAKLADAWRPVRRADLRSPMPDVVNFEHWFSLKSWAELQGCLEAIDSIRLSGNERAFLLTLFSSVLRRVSNADDQSHKTYVSHTYSKTPSPVRQTFEQAMGQAVARVREFHAARDERGTAVILPDADARDISLEDDSVDLMVTSPPYLDSIDYMYNFMLEYFWLGARLGIPDRRSFNEARRLGIGSKRPTEDEQLPPSLSELIDIEHVQADRRRSVASYMCGMDQHFAEAARVLHRDGRYAMVVGNSQSSARSIPVHDCLVRLAAGHGFALEKAFGYRIRRHYMKFPRKGRGGIILIDWVLVFNRTDCEVCPAERLPLLEWTLAPDAVAH